MIRRASSAPLYSKCPAAAYREGDEVAIDRVDDYGTFGTAVHDAGAKIVHGIEFDTGELAVRYGLDDAAKRRMLYMIGVIWRWWNAHGEAFTKDDGTLRVLDFKTTRLKDVQYDPQLMEYLFLAYAMNGCGIGLPPGVSVEAEMAHGSYTGHADVLFVPSQPVKKCQYIILFLEDQTHAVSNLLDPDTVAGEHDAYCDRIDNWDHKTYHPGGQCWYCGRSATCPGLNHELANIGLLRDMESMQGAVTALADADCVKLWDRIGLGIKFLERARECIKLRAMAQGNVLQGDGRKLVVEEQIRHPLKPMPAWPILKQYLTDDELAPAVSISKTVALGAIAEKAPRGQKGKVKQQVEAELEAADAFEEERIMFPRLTPSAAASNEKLIEGA